MRRVALALAILAALSFAVLTEVRSARADRQYVKDSSSSPKIEKDGVCEIGSSNFSGLISYRTDEATTAELAQDSHDECFQNATPLRATTSSFYAAVAQSVETPTRVPYPDDSSSQPYPGNSSSQPYPGNSSSQPLLPCLTAMLPAFLALLAIKRHSP